VCRYGCDTLVLSHAILEFTLLVGVQELVFIRLEELQKEKNAVLVKALAHVVAVVQHCS
jgi:hypothetical protein